MIVNFEFIISVFSKLQSNISILEKSVFCTLELTNKAESKQQCLNNKLFSMAPLKDA